MDEETIQFTKQMHQELTSCYKKDINRYDLSAESYNIITKYMYQNSILRKHTSSYITDHSTYAVPIVDDNNAYWLTDDNNHNNAQILSTKTINVKNLIYNLQIDYKDLDKQIAVCNLLENHILPRFVSEEDTAFLYGDGINQPQGIINENNDGINPNNIIQIKDANTIIRTIHQALQKLPAAHIQGSILLVNSLFIDYIGQQYNNNLAWLLNDHKSYLGHRVIQTQLLKPEHIAVLINPYKNYKIVDSSKITVCKLQHKCPHLNLMMIKSTGGFVVDYNGVVLIKNNIEK